MINNSDFLIAYVKYDLSSREYKTLSYAPKKNVTIININRNILT